MSMSNADYKKESESEDLSDYMISNDNSNISEATPHEDCIKDKNGESKNVVRMKIKNAETDIIVFPTDKNIVAKPSEASETAAKRMFENQDKNSDVVNNRTS